VHLLCLLPYRSYVYKKLKWHYFLFDLCYYVNILCLVFLWILPQSPSLFVACYCLSHGAVASAVITWRNSLVFHDADKVTSLFIHVYPAFTFMVIRWVVPSVPFFLASPDLLCQAFLPGLRGTFPCTEGSPSFTPLASSSF
jgi:Protein of unknown function (DUF2838)